METPDFTYALVRGVPDSFDAAITRSPDRSPVDLERARAQHAAYVEALRGAGVDVVALPPEATQPDCCFVEDQALVLAERAFLLRSGSPARRAEAGAVAEALRPFFPLATMEAPASADGGDLMVLHGALVVGQSARTNRAGVEWLGRAAAEAGLALVVLPVPGDELHLKSVCSPLDGHRVVAVEGVLRPDDFPPGTDVIWIPAEEAAAANVLPLGGRVLVATGFPRSAERLARAGYEPVLLDNDEIRKRDGALTCLSIRFRPPRVA